ncbi:MAG: paraquat-inducible protein A [Coraliomargarita sp.]|nr:paraquat-inducible protein A [Coraliomargarita sp.]
MSADPETDQWMACPRCDHLHDLSDLKDGDKARCSECGELLTVYREDGLHRVLAGSVAAMIFLVIALAYPFMSFRSSGVESVMTLPSGLARLVSEGMPDLAIVVVTVILVIPALILWLAGSLSVALIFGWNTSWSKPVARWIFHLKTWSMAEVFLIGVIVSLVKIMHMATVIIGLSFWAYAGFIVCFTIALANLDAYQVWRRIEQLSEGQA